MTMTLTPTTPNSQKPRNNLPIILISLAILAVLITATFLLIASPSESKISSDRLMALEQMPCEELVIQQEILKLTNSDIGILEVLDPGIQRLLDNACKGKIFKGNESTFIRYLPLTYSYVISFLDHIKIATYIDDKGQKVYIVPFNIEQIPSESDRVNRCVLAVIISNANSPSIIASIETMVDGKLKEQIAEFKSNSLFKSFLVKEVIFEEIKKYLTSEEAKISKRYAWYEITLTK